MKRKRCTVEQIVGVLEQRELGAPEANIEHQSKSLIECLLNGRRRSVLKLVYGIQNTLTRFWQLPLSGPESVSEKRLPDAAARSVRRLAYRAGENPVPDIVTIMDMSLRQPGGDSRRDQSVQRHPRRPATGFNPGPTDCQGDIKGEYPG